MTDKAQMELIAALETEYLVWSNQHRAWWRPDSAGYTRHVAAAGIYSRREALQISRCARDGWLRPDRPPDELPIAIADLPDDIRAALKARASLTKDSSNEVGS